MLNFAYQYFNLDYKKFVNVKFKKLKKNEVKEKDQILRNILKSIRLLLKVRYLVKN